MNLFEKSVHFALQKHDGQRRRTEHTPYILHPMEVAAIAATMTADEEVLAAAILHDTIEDADTTPEEIIKEFGERVYALVQSETENKRKGLPEKDTWRIRKEESLEVLRTADSEEVKILWLSDKLANMRSFARMYRRVGNDLWQIFHQNDPRQQAWYYRTIASYLSDLDAFDAYHEYIDLVNLVFETV